MRLRYVCTALILGCCTLVGSAQTGSVSAKVAVGTQMSPAGGPLFACFLRRVGTTNAGTLQIADAEYLAGGPGFWSCRHQQHGGWTSPRVCRPTL